MNLDDASTKLIEFCRPHVARTQRPWRIAISGLPGSGKSTLARAVVAKARGQGWPALALSLDDFYLPRRARQQLAAHVHPLLATRGVPGTHDLALLRHVLDELEQAAPAHPVAIPRFDKGRDTRQPPSRWPQARAVPKLLILEGWCLGIRPQPAKALTRPVNALEADEDVDGFWRRWVNHHLADYLPLWEQADMRVAIRVPDWASVQNHRRLAEQSLRKRHAPRAMNDAELMRFLQHYERLGRRALAAAAQRVDLQLRSRDLFAEAGPINRGCG